jgi:Icc protein
MVWTALGEVASAEGVAKGGTLGPCPRRLMGVRDLGEVRVIGLDTLEAGRVCGNLGDEQRDWLSQELSRSEKPTLLFMHHPPMRVGTWWLDKDLLRDLVPFETQVRRSPVVAIFAGHVHQEAEGHLGPVPVFATPSTAYQFPPRSWWPRSARTKASYRWIDARRDRVKSHVVRL